jgi:hypothetical protein
LAAGTAINGGASAAAKRRRPDGKRQNGRIISPIWLGIPACQIPAGIPRLFGIVGKIRKFSAGSHDK